MINGNTYALNKHLDEVEKCEKAQELFDRDIESLLQDMEDIYFEIRVLSRNYNGYDFESYAKECVKNYLGV